MATADWTDERLNDAFDRLTGEIAALRADMKDMRAELKAEMRDMRSELDGRMSGLETHLRADMRDLRADLRLFWMVFAGSYLSVMATVVFT